MKIRITFVVLLFFLTILINLIWLAIGILVTGSLYVLYYSPLRWSLWIRKNAVANFLLSFLVIIAIAVLLRVFIFEIYTIPSESMEDELVNGDNVIMSKIHYGPAMPRSPFEIPWLGALFYLNKQARAKAFTDWWTYYRLDGLTHISRNDIVVFTKDESKECHIKRCVGLPGDTIRILRGNLWIDQSAYNPPATAKRYYKYGSIMRTV